MKIKNYINKIVAIAMVVFSIVVDLIMILLCVQNCYRIDKNSLT